MKNSTKTEISQALNTKILTGISANKIADDSAINKAYISLIKNGIFEVEQTNRPPSPISDSVFFKLADYLGYKFEYDAHFQNSTFERISQACKWAQARKLVLSIDSMTSGAGKTYALERYAQDTPNVLYIKIESLMKGKDLINALMKKLHLSQPGRMSNNQKLAMITGRLITNNYLIVLDEFESAATDMYRVLKDLLDATYQKTGLVISGKGMIEEIRAAAHRGRKLMPQIWRRIRTNQIILDAFSETDVANACKEHGITDQEVVRLFQRGIRDSRASWVYPPVRDFQALNQYVREIHTHLVAQRIEVNIDSVKALFRPL